MNWWNDAACLGQPIDLFFPGIGEKAKVQKAKAICRDCTVTVECLRDTLNAEAPEARHGVFGGLSSAERKLKYGVASEVPQVPSDSMAFPSDMSATS